MRILNSFALALAAAASQLVFAVANQPGTLDNTWSSDGKAFASISPQSSLTGNDLMSAIAVQADGKVLLAGVCRGPGASTTLTGCMARFNSDGSVDNSFFLHGTLNGFTVRGDALTVQPDGRIVMSGGCGLSFCAARFLANGTLDTSFGNAGVRQVLFTGVVAGFTGAARQSDGKLVFGGYCNTTEFCIVRLTADGNLDTDFGAGTGFRVHNLTGGTEFIRHIAVEADGKIVAAGQCNNLACIVRLLSTGALDTVNFNGTGFRTGVCATSTDVYGLARQYDGRYVVAGTAVVSGLTSACVSRLNTDGSTDNSFAGGALTTQFGATNTQVRDLVLQSDGRVIVIAKCGNPDQSICARRYHSDGSIDASFASANAGLLRTEMIAGQGLQNSLRGILDGGGKLLVGSSCITNGTNDDFCVARYDGGPFAYRDCTADIDGDGRVLPTTDALILFRVATGMAGSAVLQGVQFAPNATRTTWPSIRDYLSIHCGIPR